MHSLDGYTVKDYGRMILDERRSQPFVQALLRAVKPGCTVLDIGTSTGYFAFLAVQAGAAIVRVHDVAATVDALKVLAATRTADENTP